MYRNFKKLSSMEIKNIKINSKVKSIMSHTDGIILEKDELTETIKIQWEQSGVVSTMSNHLSKLSSVVYLGGIA